MRSWLVDNLGLKLLSVVLAIFLWAVVVGEQKVEVTMNIPLEIKGLPRDLVMVNEPTDALEVRVRGPKTLISTLSPSEVVPGGLPSSFVEGENLIAVRPDMVRVPRGIEVVDISPHRVRVVLDAIVEREVEVSPRVEGAPPKGYVVKGVTSSPPRVRMSGPRGDLRRLTRIYTLPINLDGHSASFTTRAMLEPVGRQVRALEDTPIIVAVEIGTAKP
jgi:YbbR domain-containing protein